MRIDCSITENYLKEKRRMTYDCDISCIECPLDYRNNGKRISCRTLQHKYPVEAVAIVQEWSDRKSTPTNKEKFIEVMKNVFGIKLNITSGGCPLYMSYVDKLRENLPCDEWWDEPYKEPKEKE